MSRIIRTSHGTLEFRRAKHGLVLVMNGRHYFSVTDLLTTLLDIYYERQDWHPRGSTGYLEEVTGLTLDPSCPLCDGPGPATRCPRCSVGRCSRCVPSHDNRSLCVLTAEAADTHRLMREGADLDETDFYFARRVMASSYVLRGQH